MKLEIVGLIYKSVDYLRFEVDQLSRFSEGVPWRIVANDPSPEVLDYLIANKIPHDLYRDPHPEHYYLRRIYRCINWFYQNSLADVVCEVQSDMAFSRGWLSALASHYDSGSIPVSRLVQPYDCDPSTHSIRGDFGTVGNFDESKWLRSADSLRSLGVASGGFYIPRLMDRAWFLDRGGFPEGNLRSDGSISTGPEDFHRGGDEYFFDASGKEHKTVLSSLVYHLHEGEMRDK